MKQFCSFFLFLFLFLALVQCGGGSGGGSDGEPPPDDGNNGGNNDGDTVNLTKLEGTPFEGRIIGDDLDPNTFLCGQYRTDTISGFPIPVFAAYFTASEEETIQEGIQVANDGIGFEAYQWTNIWNDTARVILKVNSLQEFAIGDEIVGGKTFSHDYGFGKAVASTVTADWVIAIANSLSRWLVAHEIGHGTGIENHDLIDYENDVLLDLEPGSIMEADGGTALTDYNFMMQKQGEIMQTHLNQIGIKGFIDDECN